MWRDIFVVPAREQDAAASHAASREYISQPIADPPAFCNIYRETPGGLLIEECPRFSAQAGSRDLRQMGTEIVRIEMGSFVCQEFVQPLLSRSIILNRHETPRDTRLIRDHDRKDGRGIESPHGIGRSREQLYERRVAKVSQVLYESPVAIQKGGPVKSAQ